jgi:hypothetical protein
MTIFPTLPTGPFEQVSMDYARLRDEGLQLLGRLAGTQWADYNTHDPGITNLEQLCYAITDLGYRIAYPMPELLAGGDPGLPCPEAIFPSRSGHAGGPAQGDARRRWHRQRLGRGRRLRAAVLPRRCERRAPAARRPGYQRCSAGADARVASGGRADHRVGCFRNDGNLVTYRADGTALWALSSNAGR